MKPTRQRAHLPMQTDLFDAATTLAPLTGLQQRHDELVELLSLLLWRVASQAASTQQAEDDDEQDRP